VTTPNDPTRSHDSLDAVIAVYILAVEAGDVPDRQELLDDHPGHAEALRAFFADLDRMDRVSLPLRLAAGPEATGAAEPNGHAAPASVRYFGDYALLEEIARGGMGIVYKSRQVSLNRLVALKMILAGGFASSRDIQRFRTEAESAANLDHPHIVPIYEVGEHDGQQYYAMKFVEGTSLAGHPRGDIRAEVAGVVAVARAVHHAHQRGVLHRDLKPSNVLVDSEGTRLVTDFGLAKRLATGDRSITETGQVLGTPRYMAPEQAAGRKNLTVAVDVYSLGVILYERLTGRPPFTGDDVLTLLRHVRESEPPRPSSIVQGVDRDLETVVLKCLEKDPAQRYGSAEALANDLDRWLGGEPIAARPSGGLERVVKWARRRPLAATLAAVSAFAALAVVGLIVGWRYNIQLKKARDAEMTQRDLAEQREHQARSYWYAADIGLAQRTWEAGRVTEAVALLDRHLPGPGEEDRRGFEWFYLRHLCASALLHFRALEPDSHFKMTLSFSPDGHSLYAAKGAGFVSENRGRFGVWDAGTGERRRLLRDSPSVGPVRFAGGCFAFVDGDQVWIGDLATGSEHRSAAVARGRSEVEALTTDGKHAVLFGGIPGIASRWVTNLETGRELIVLPEDFGAADRIVAISPDGRRLWVSGSEKKRTADGPKDADARPVPALWSWELPSGREAAVIEPGFATISALAVAPDSRQIAVAGTLRDSTIDRPALAFWDTMSSPPRLTHRLDLPTGTIRMIAFGPDGQTLALSSSEDRFVRIFRLTFDPRRFEDPGTWREQSVLRGATGTIAALRFSADGGRIAACDRSGAITVWDARAVPEAEQISIDQIPQGAESAFLPDGRTLAVMGATRIDLFDTTSRRRIGRIEGPDRSPEGFAISPDGRVIATLWSEGDWPEFRQGVDLWDIATRRLIRTLVAAESSRGSWGSDIAFSPDGRVLAVGRGSLAGWGSDSNPEPADPVDSVWLWDLSTGHERAPLKGAAGPLAFSPDGRVLVTTGSDNRSICLWDAVSGSRVAQWVVSERVKYGKGTFSPDGRLFAAAAFDGGGVRLWDVASGRVVHTLRCPSKPLVAFAPDGKTLVTADADNSLILWQTSTGQELLSLKGHQWVPSSIAFSPDGSILASTASEVDNWDPALLWRAPREP
jgi:eukaryotic-like serine/threonine-protein kinase